MTTLVAPAPAVTIRGAVRSDIADVVTLVNGFAAERVMLPRTPDSVEGALHSFVVAVDARDRVLACGTLKEYSPSLAEVASVAVAAEAHGLGLGRRIVEAIEQLARQRGVPELFALTLTPGFFERIGYTVADVARYPEKIQRDCVSCPRRQACNEICVMRELAAAGSSPAARMAIGGVAVPDETSGRRRLRIAA